MRYSEITEAPIGTLDVSDMDRPGSFSDADRKLLSNPAHIEKIKKRFDFNTHDFDLYFINQIGVTYAEPNPYQDPDDSTKRPFRSTQRYFDDVEEETGTISPQVAKSKFGIVKLDPGAITVIFLSNTNEDNPIPMTPWMVAHRFAHVITDNVRLPPELSNVMSSERTRLPDAFSNPLLKEFGIKVSVLAMMTSRSARRGILQSGEMREEMISQYLTVKGGVSLALPANVEIPDGVDRNLVNQRIEQLARQCNVRLDKIMDECIGHVFVSV